MIRIPQYRIAVGSWDDYTAAIGQVPPPYEVIISLCDRTPLFSGTVGDLCWFPINERAPWGYSVFFWAKRILDFRTGRGQSILIHCQSGVHRSPMILFTWLLSLQVASRRIDLNAINDLIGSEHDYADLYLYDVRRGTVPADLEHLYELMLDPGMGLTDCLERMDRHRAH